MMQGGGRVLSRGGGQRRGMNVFRGGVRPRGTRVCDSAPRTTDQPRGEVTDAHASICRFFFDLEATLLSRFAPLHPAQPQVVINPEQRNRGSVQKGVSAAKPPSRVEVHRHRMKTDDHVAADWSIFSLLF